MALYSFIPLSAVAALNDRVAQWEQQHIGMHAIIVPSYCVWTGLSNTVQYTVGQYRFVDPQRLPDGSYRSLMGFCLIADDHLLEDTFRTEIETVGGKIFQNNAEYLMFESSQQNLT